MSNTETSNGDISQLNRRRFMKLSAAGVVCLAAMELLPGATKSASASTTEEIKEKYQIFVPYETAARGGSQSVTLRSGDTIEINIPWGLSENSGFRVKGVGIGGNDVTVICHTLYGTNGIYSEINRTNFIKNKLTKNRCNAIYQSLKDGKFVGDLAALDLLNYVVESSKLDESIRKRYSIASNNSRLQGIEDAIADAFARSELDEERKKRIKGTYEYVRAGEPVPDFAALTDLDAIVAGSHLPGQVKQLYLTASATSQALTVDFLIVQLINQKLSGYSRDYYLSLYQKVRDGETISSEKEGEIEYLDRLIIGGDIPEACKTIYLTARTQFSGNDPLLDAIQNSSELTEGQKQKYVSAYQKVIKSEPGQEIKKEFAQDGIALLDSFFDSANIPPTYKYAYQLVRNRFVVNNRELFEENLAHIATRQAVKLAGGAVVPMATSALSALGVQAGTGAAISSLGGAAATNATLAALGGGSVAAGGLGMLGGLVVVTGGAALIGAAGLLSITLLTQMDGEDYVNLGVAGTVGVLTSATVALAVWTGAGFLGVAGSLSGAAATAATISALGGLSFMTGGIALIALAVGGVVWWALKGNKSRQDALRQAESRAYMLTEPSDDRVVTFIQKNLPKEYEHEDAYLAPDIPLDKLSNAMSMYGYLDPGEKILALIDTSGNHNAKDGILLTDRSIIWRPAYSDVEYAYYSNLNSSSRWKISKTMLESGWDEYKFADFLTKLKEQVQG
jgi:hypothetical protein